MTRRTESSMDDSVIRDPAHAAAAGKCWLARKMGGKVGNVVANHPDECAWCEFEPDFIIDKITEFLEWGGLKRVDVLDDGNPMTRPLRHQVEGFQMLPAEEQARLVRVAQGFDTPALIDDNEPERPADLYR